MGFHTFAGRSRSSIGRSITSKATRLGLNASSKTKIWTISVMGPKGKVLAEGLTDDEAWNFLEIHAQKRKLGDVPDSLKNLIESVINSSLHQAVSEQLSPIEKLKESILYLDLIFERCKQTGFVSEKEYAAINELYSKAVEISAGIDMGIDTGVIRR